MHFDDLSEYSYTPGHPKALNVGWLDSCAPFPTGEVAPALVEKLRRFVMAPMNEERGVHNCPFCQNTLKLAGHHCTVDGKELWLGSAEIRVRAKDGTVFASPDMIYHYVVDHHYLPPQRFLDALAEA